MPSKDPKGFNGAFDKMREFVLPDSAVQCHTCGETPVPDKYYGSKCGCSPVLSEASKAHLDNIEACRTAWEASDRSVPFPDHWAGWQAATLLINERALRISDQVDIVEIDGVSYVDLGDCALVMNELAESKLREATLAGQLNAALQPTLAGEAFKQLRKELDANYRTKRRFKEALQNIADGCENPMSYAQLVLDGVL